MPSAKVNRNGNGTKATIIRPEKEQGAACSPPSQLRMILLDDGTSEKLPRHIYKRNKTSICYRPTTGTTAIEVTGRNSRSTTAYSITRDVELWSKTGLTRENLNRASAIKERVESGEDLTMVWAAKIFKSWQVASSIRLRHSDLVTITWGSTCSRKKKVQTHAFTLEDMDTSEKEIDRIVNGGRRLRPRDVLVAPDGENVVSEGEGYTLTAGATSGNKLTPLPGLASPPSRINSGKRRISTVISPEYDPKRVKAEKMKTQRVEIGVKDTATFREDARDRELLEIGKKREKIIKKSKLITMNRARAMRSAEKVLAKDLEDAKLVYDEAVRQSQRVFVDAKQQIEEVYRKDMGDVEAHKHKLFRDFWGKL